MIDIFSQGELITFFLGAFILGVMYWDALVTRNILKKDKSTVGELNPIMKFFFDTIGIDTTISISRILVTFIVFYPLLFVEDRQAVRNSLTFISLVPAILIGWHISGDFHMEQVKKTLKIMRIDQKKFRKTMLEVK